MTSVAISSLPVATGLNTTDVVPIVQSGVTKQTTAGAFLATMSGFTPTGAGGISRTQQAKSSDITSIADYSTPTNFMSRTNILGSSGSTQGTRALIVTGTVGDVTGYTFRTDTGVEIQQAYAGISLFRTANPGDVGTTECFWVAGAFDSAGNRRKTASISSLWASNDTTTGYGNLRFNATKSGGTLDDTFLVGVGGHGVTMFPTDSFNGNSSSGMFTILGEHTIKAAGTNLTGTAYLLATTRDPNATSRGVCLGYDTNGSGGIITSFNATSYLSFWTHNGAAWAEKFRVDPNGLFLVGVTSGIDHVILRNIAKNNIILRLRGADANNTGTHHAFFEVDVSTWNAANAAYWVGSDSVTSRSINASGTVNASGTDYAEYETLSDGCGKIAKGQIVGFDADGKLTDRWSLSISFGIKSTDPSFIGGDGWGSHEAVGRKPEEPIKPVQPGSAPEEPLAPTPPKEPQNPTVTQEMTKAEVNNALGAYIAASQRYNEALAHFNADLETWKVKHAIWENELAEYERKVVEYDKANADYIAQMEAFKAETATWTEKYEAARVTVDRVAYSGKVPVNIQGAKPGEYIIAVQGDGDSISGKSVQHPSEEERPAIVGRVRRVLEDGRPEVVVMFL